MAPAIYLDYLATTPVDPRVLEAMLPFFSQHFGNPSSKTHAFGWTAADAVDRARQQVAGLIGAQAREIIFTSGATEANNLAIKGAVLAPRQRRRRIVTCATEHKAVLDACTALKRDGFETVQVPVDNCGQLDWDRFEAAVDEDTALVSVMAANNEIGTLHALERIGDLVRRRGVIWHCDAAQAAGKVPLDVEALGVDLLSISGHKVYGPKGVGALYVRRRGKRTRLLPQIEGGGQEGGIRGGTLNVPGIVGLGRACQICAAEMEDEASRLIRLREALLRRLDAGLGGVHQNAGGPRLPGCLSLRFEGLDGGQLLNALPDVALSAGAACSSGTGAPSHVLKAIGLSDAEAVATLRIGLGRFTTETEIERAADRLAAEIENTRQSVPAAVL